MYIQCIFYVCVINFLPNKVISFTGKLGFAKKLYDPKLISLEIDGIDFQNIDLGEACLTEFFGTNTTLEYFSISWGELTDTMMAYIARHSPQLKNVSLV